MHLENDTIVAQATASGRAGVAVVRLSGPKSRDIAKLLVSPSDVVTSHDIQRDTSSTLKGFMPRYCHLTKWFDSSGQMIDEGLTIYFPGPASFTGEDVVELHPHGGIVIVDWLIQQCLSYGARVAQPGEFTQRAYLNDKLDLAQAEAVASLIDASSRRAAVCAVRSLQGEFSQQIHQIVDQLISLRTHVEAAIDFVDEDLETDDLQQIEQKLQFILKQIIGLSSQAQSGVRLHEGARIAIVGEPNAGKSSLLNELAKTQAAIVSDIPGTTRDIIKERLEMGGVPVEVLDTAGLRDTTNEIEQQGIERALEVLSTADILLWVFDATTERVREQERKFLKYCGPQANATPRIFLASKIDLLSKKAYESFLSDIDDENLDLVLCSVKKKQGIDQLIEKILHHIGVSPSGEGQFIARRRHLNALDNSKEYLLNAQEILLNQPLELVAEELKMAQESLGSITGRFTSDDLLGKIFSTFCVGK